MRFVENDDGLLETAADAPAADALAVSAPTIGGIMLLLFIVIILLRKRQKKI
jgi:LPXTG-motif cell wall-anchored protein